MHWWGVWPLLFLLAATPVAALSLDFSNLPSSVDPHQEFSVDVTLSCPGCKSDSYLRGVFFLSGTNYFGFTQNNSGAWVNLPGSQADQYFLVAQTDLEQGSWSGRLVVRPDPEASAYTGPGNYFFKVGRYTSGGDNATWAAAVPIAITGPSPTPTPAPTSKPDPTPKPTSPLKPTPLPSPTRLPPSVTPTFIPTPVVLSASASSVPGPSLIPGPSAVPVSLSPTAASPPPSPPWPAYTLIGVGSLIFAAAFIFKL